MTSKQIAQLLSSVIKFDVLSTHDLVLVLGKVRIDKTKGCWLYREDWSEYATLKKKPLHRLIFKIFKGEIEGNNFICHKCDRPGCINPDHLFQGTHSENMQDARRKGRSLAYSNKKGRYPKNYKELDRQRHLQLPPEYFHAHWSSIRSRLRERAKLSK